MESTTGKKPRKENKPVKAAKRRRPEGDAQRPQTASFPASPCTTLGNSSLGGGRGGKSKPPVVGCSEGDEGENEEKNKQAEHQNYDDLLASAVFAYDWYETGGVIEWSPLVSRPAFWSLQHAQKEAIEGGNQPQVIELAGRSVMVHPRGLGTGRQSRMEHRLEWAGVLIGLSNREIASRQHANFYLKVPGEACVIHGAAKVRSVVGEIIEALGGSLTDEWVKRIDLCLDIPHLAVQGELQRAFDAGWFLTSFRDWHPFDGAGGKKGFVAYSAGRCRLTVYDKRADAFERHDGVYQLAMQTNRWGGPVTAATRVEFQLHNTWLRQFKECKSSSSVDENLGTLVGKLVNTECRPLFVMTDRLPDKKNKHQSRCGVHPLWAAIAKRFQQSAGEPTGKLTPIDRGKADFARLYAMGSGAITSAAAKMKVVIETPEDAGVVLRKLMENVGKPENDLARRWERKAREQGTYDDLMSFPGEAA